MPVHQFDKAVVKNLTSIPQTLRSFDGDSVMILPNAEVPIMHKFLEWQTPSPRVIRIISEHFKPEQPVFETAPLEEKKEVAVEKISEPFKSE